MQDADKVPQYLQPYRTTNPANNKVEKEFPFATEDEIKEAIEKCHKSFQKHRKSSMQERKEKVLRLADLVDKNKEHFAELQALEMGKPVGQGIKDFVFTSKYLRYLVSVVDETLKPKEFQTATAKKVICSYDPLGVIYVMIPWNFPILLNLFACVPFLLAGNTVLYKGANITPQCSQAAEKIYIEAGFDNNEFINLFIKPDNNELVIGDFRIRGVSFTGNTEAGEIIAQIASKYAKKSVLELGGSDAFVVLDDADIQKAAQNAALGRLLNAGQCCVAAKRIIVDKKISKEFIEKFKEEFAKWEVSDPSSTAPATVGPLARFDLVEGLKKQALDSITKGAQLIYGDKTDLETKSDPEKGNYFKPIILLNPPKGCQAYDEELFGPVASIFEVSNEEEAVELANDSRYGLGGTVFGQNEERAAQVAGRIDTGHVHINQYGLLAPELPFGGVKDSGTGKHSSAESLKEFVNIKSVVLH